jgi:hypothetical protein
LTKNIAADLHLQGLSANELQNIFESQLDTIEEQLIALPTRYPNPQSLTVINHEQA